MFIIFLIAITRLSESLEALSLLIWSYVPFFFNFSEMMFLTYGIIFSMYLSVFPFFKLVYI